MVAQMKSKVCSSGLWTAPDGASFPYFRWDPPGEARARLLGIHGLGADASDFDEPARRLALELGVRTFAVNLRGQGCDPVPERRGAELDEPAIRADLEAFTRDQGDEHLPLFVAGESMGAMIALRCCVPGNFTPAPEGLVLMIPVVALRYETPWLTRIGLHLAAAFSPGRRIRLGDVALDREQPIPLGRDPAGIHYVRHGSQKLPLLTLRFLLQLEKLMQGAATAGRAVTQPTLLLHAGRDCYIRVEQTRRFFELLPAREKREVLFPEAHHLLLRDYDTDAVLEQILGWFGHRLAARDPAQPAPLSRS